MAPMCPEVPDPALLGEMVGEVRALAGNVAAALSDRRLAGLLRVHRFDAAAAAAAAREHVELERRFPAANAASPEAEAALRTGRFRFLGFARGGRPVVVTDWKWGRFLEVEGGEEALLEAYVVFLRRAGAQAGKLLGGGGGPPPFISIGVGGPPPLCFARRVAAMRGAEFPEPTALVVLYPVQASSARGKMIGQFMQSWLPPGLRDALRLCANREELLRQAGMPASLLPDDLMRDALPPREQLPIVTGHRVDLLTAAQQQGTADTASKAQDGPELVIKHTFVDLRSTDEDQPMRRTNSQPQLGAAEDREDDDEPAACMDQCGAADGRGGSGTEGAPPPPPPQQQHAAPAAGGPVSASPVATAQPGTPGLTTPPLRALRAARPLLGDLDLSCTTPEALDAKAAELRALARQFAAAAQQAQAAANFLEWNPLSPVMGMWSAPPPVHQPGYFDMHSSLSEEQAGEEWGEHQPVWPFPRGVRCVRTVQDRSAKGGDAMWQQQTLGAHLAQLRDRDPNCIFIARRIGPLGFQSHEILAKHFCQCGEVSHVFVPHSKAIRDRTARAQHLRIRPGSLGFVVMSSTEGVARALAAGSEQVVAGHRISVEPFRRVAKPRPAEPNPNEASASGTASPRGESSASEGGAMPEGLESPPVQCCAG